MVASGIIGNNIPEAMFSCNTTTGNAPFSVNFYDQSTNSPSLWFWEFGDGNTSNLQNPNHTYYSSGAYTVKLTASNDDGSDSETKSNFIIVNEPDHHPTLILKLTLPMEKRP